MRPTPNLLAEPHRRIHPTLGSSPWGENCGYFEIACSRGWLRVIASDGTMSGWEHVSVSLVDGIPSWLDMKQVKELFWGDDETVLEFHPEKASYVNAHDSVLHLWRQVGVNHPLPPRLLI